MLKVVRILNTPVGCIGILLKDEHPFCWTLENPETMLPIGRYEVRQKGNIFQIISDGKEPFFFGSGNTAEAAECSILLGFKVFSPRALAESEKALLEFGKAMKGCKEGELFIRRLS